MIEQLTSTLYVVVDVGCLCCHAQTNIVGVFTDENLALEVAHLANTKEVQAHVRDSTGYQEVHVYEVDLEKMLNRASGDYFAKFVEAKLELDELALTDLSGVPSGWQQLWSEEGES